MRLIDIVLASYPLYATFHAIKKPRNAVLKHWLIYWTIYIWLCVFDYFTLGILPMIGIVKIVILLPNWSLHVTDFSFSTLIVWWQKGYRKLKQTKYWDPKWEKWLDEGSKRMNQIDERAQDPNWLMSTMKWIMG